MKQNYQHHQASLIQLCEIKTGPHSIALTKLHPPQSAE